MATRNYLDGIAPVLRGSLAPGETVQAASPLIKDPGVTEDVSVADEIKSLIDPSLLILGTHPGELMQQATYGRALVGPRESIAGRLFFAIDELTSPTLAVTDAGIAIFKMDIKSRGEGWFAKLFGAVDQIAELHHRVRRADILGARQAPEGVLRRGRILMGFADGSGCALVCAPPSLAEPVVEAIGRK